MPVPVRRSYVDVAHGQIHLRVARPEVSTRPPLVCLHMSPASGLVFETVMAELGTDRVVIAPDTPGFGASDALPAYPSIGDYADVVAEVVERLAPDTLVDLVGYHTGSFTSVELATRRTDLVRRIVTVSMPVFEPDELVRLRRVYSKEPIFTADGERLSAKWRWFQEFFGVPGSATVEQAARIFYARLSGGERHWWGHHAAFSYDVVPVLEALPVPITVVNIDDDLTEHSRRAGPHLNSGRIEERPEWTHGFLDTHAEAAAELIRSCLDAPVP